MNERTKLPWKLRQISKNYIGIYAGDYCVVSICTNDSNGLADAEFIVRACNSHEDLLDLVKRYAAVLKEGHSKCANAKCVACIELEQANAVIASAKPEQESTL